MVKMKKTVVNLPEVHWGNVFKNVNIALLRWQSKDIQCINRSFNLNKLPLIAYANLKQNHNWNKSFVVIEVLDSVSWNAVNKS